MNATPVACAATLDEPKPLKGVWKNITYWLGAVGIMLFSGFIIHDVCTEYGGFFLLRNGLKDSLLTMSRRANLRDPEESSGTNSSPRWFLFSMFDFPQNAWGAI